MASVNGPSFLLTADADEVMEKSQRIYDRAADRVWQVAVYEPVHAGCQFTNMAGRAILDFIMKHAGLGPESRVLELCSGLGANCAYLAARSGCSVTGVEMNPHQIEAARGRMAAIGSSAPGRVELVQADVSRWRSPASYDVVFAVDSLALIARLDEVLSRAREALKTSGALVLAEMMAGQGITPELREYAWTADGIILHTPDEYVTALDRAGFSGIELTDITDCAQRCFDLVHAAVIENEEEIIRSSSADVHRDWLELSDIYRRAFRDQRFVYTRVVATPRGAA